MYDTLYPNLYHGRIMANERNDFQRMREISEMIFRKENMSLIVIGPTKGITENKLRELL